jgi:peptidyl-prolyl cis-trans isomerase C
MRKTLSITLLAAAAAVLPAMPAAAQVAKVNGVTIPQARADLLLREAAAQGRQETPELRDAVKNRLIESELITQEAVKLGLNKNPQVVAQIELSRQQILVSAYVNEMARRNPPSDEALRKLNERLKDHPAASEYKARHILLASENEAKDIITQLKGGADFARLATEKSRDEGSKAQGGELPWGPPTGYVRPFAEAMTKLKKGEMTEAPVQTQFGWHVIRMDDTRPMSFEALKPQLTQIAQRENVQKIIEGLRAKAKVE